ncbi:MAG TPA: hypothetical protein VMB77_08025 [Syntrophales bacterium]|nr:hypothetical protein [Syntrophales bacterium]
MIAAYFVAVLLFIVLFFAFFHYSPKGRKEAPAYNVATLILVVSLSGYYVWNLQREMEGAANDDLFFTIAPLAVLGIAIVVFAASALLRNYVIFRR